MRVKIADIQGLAKPSELNQKTIGYLVDSIREVGLLHPVVLQEGTLQMISGQHRTAACVELGHDDVEATMVDLGSLRQRLATLDENFARNQWTVQDRGLKHVERKELYEQLYPETKQYAAGGHASGSIQQGIRENPVPSFVQNTADLLGVCEQVVKKQVKIGKDITPEAHEAIRGTDLADNQGALYEVSRLSPEEQLPAIKRATSPDVDSERERFGIELTPRERIQDGPDPERWKKMLEKLKPRATDPGGDPEPTPGERAQRELSQRMQQVGSEIVSSRTKERLLEELEEQIFVLMRDHGIGMDEVGAAFERAQGKHTRTMLQGAALQAEASRSRDREPNLQVSLKKGSDSLSETPASRAEETNTPIPSVPAEVAERPERPSAAGATGAPLSKEEFLAAMTRRKGDYQAIAREQKMDVMLVLDWAMEWAP